MKSGKSISLLTIVLITAMSAVLQASPRVFTVADQSKMTIYGSANVTDWEADVKTIRGNIHINKPENADWANAQPSWFEKVEISFPVRDIDADSRRMNNNMHGYLKMDRHPEITYRLLEVRDLAASGNPGAVLTVRGVVTAAGVEKEITHNVEIRQNESGVLVVTGSKDLKMTDFGIDPPTAMLGSVRSRDEMTITFELYLN